MIYVRFKSNMYMLYMKYINANGGGHYQSYGWDWSGHERQQPIDLWVEISYTT